MLPLSAMEVAIFPFTGEHGTSMSCLLEEGTYSDLTIECGEDSYTVHKAIICTRSPFFAARCDGDSKEAKSGVIKLPDDDPVAVKMMIRYLYTGTYASPKSFVAGFNGTYWEQQELHENEYDAKEKDFPGATGIVFWENRVLMRIVRTGAPSQTSTNLFWSSGSTTTLFVTKPEPSATPPGASTPVASASTAQPQGSAIPPAPSAPVSNMSASQARASTNPFAGPSPATDLFLTHPQYFNGGTQHGRQNSRNQHGGRHSCNQRGNQTPKSNFGAAQTTAVPATVPAQAPVHAQAPAPAAPAPVQPPTQRKPDFVLHAKIYALGEKYEIKDLKALALQKFAFEAAIYHYDHSFRHGAKEAYTCTVDEDRGMRDVVVDTVLNNRYLLDRWSFQNMVKETDLGFDLLMRLKSAKIIP